MKTALLLLLLLQAAMLKAQTMPGIRFGGNLSTLNGIKTSQGSYDWLRQFHGGFILSKKVGHNLYVQPELIFSQKGYTYDALKSNKVVHGDTIRYSEENHLTYIDMPILARLGSKKLYFEAGPQFSYFLAGERHVTNTTAQNGTETNHSHTRDLHGTVETFDIGFAAGLGYQTTSGLGLGFRFNQSFREVINRDNWKKNLVLQLSAFYLFGKRSELRKAAPAPAKVLPDVEYYDPKRARRKGYKIISKTNMQRVSFTKVADSERNHIEFNIISTGGFSPKDVLLAGTSGVEENTISFVGFRDVVFPFRGSIQFSTPGSLGSNSLTQSRMEYEISEPGLWRVTITISN